MPLNFACNIGICGFGFRIRLVCVKDIRTHVRTVRFVLHTCWNIFFLKRFVLSPFMVQGRPHCQSSHFGLRPVSWLPSQTIFNMLRDANIDNTLPQFKMWSTVGSSPKCLRTGQCTWTFWYVPMRPMGEKHYYPHQNVCAWFVYAYSVCEWCVLVVKYVDETRRFGKNEKTLFGMKIWCLPHSFDSIKHFR